METRWIVALVLALAVCRVTEGQLQAAENLATTINRTGCASSKVCVSSGSNCDPSGTASCFFSSITLSSQVMTVELSGSTTGFVALGLTLPNQNSTIVFVCGNNNSAAFFQTTTKNLNDITLTPVNMINVTGVQGKVNTNVSVQCVFNVSPTLSVTTLNTTFNFNSSTTAALSILNGTTTGTTLGNFSTVFDSKTQLNLIPLPPFNINRTGCGTTKLCRPEKETCNLVGSSSCFFTSIRKDGQSLLFELSGTSSGYVALGLKKAGTSVVFICANNKTQFLFDARTRNGSTYLPANVATVNSNQGFVNQSVVQCIFNTTTSFNVTTKADDLNFVVTIESGSFDGTTFGTPASQFDSKETLDLGNPAATSGTNSITGHWTYVMAVLLCALALHFM